MVFLRAIRAIACGAKLIPAYFNYDSVLAKRVPAFYGPHCLPTYLYRVWSLSNVGLILCRDYSMLAVSISGFLANAVGVSASIGFHGGLTKLASIPHMLALGSAAAATCAALTSTSLFSSPLAWVSYVSALLYYFPVVLGDIRELYQVFVLKRYFVLMPDGVVHPLDPWWGPDKSVTLDMTVMYTFARKADAGD